MRKLALLFFLIWYFAPLNARAQTSQFIDSIAQALQQKTYFTAFWGTRNSFIANRRAQITGYNIGVDFGKNLTIGGGFNFLSSPIIESSTLQIGEVLLPVFKKWNINYMGYFVEYAFYDTQRWRFTIPVQVGWGLTYLSYYLNDKLIRENRKIFLIYEPTMSGTYRITRYFGLGAHVGYRLVIKRNKSIGRLTSPIYAFSIKVFYSKLYNDFKTKFGLTKLP